MFTTSATSAARRYLWIGALLVLTTAYGSTARGQAVGDGGDLTSLSMDDLMNVEVTSVARRGQKLSETPAAIFVITQEDIRRSGARSIPDLLRIVPGFDVSSVSGNVWAVSARGFAGRWSNKLLVLIDGRSVYDPTFSGVYWDIQDVVFEDIERIEVIRGPGGTLWGANAVNGIVNIITKKTVDTHGTLISSRAGSGVDGTTAAVRHGGRMGTNGSYRVYGKAFDRPATRIDGEAAEDLWRTWRGGLRADWMVGKGALTIDAAGYGGEIGAATAVTDGSSSHPSARHRNGVGGGHLLFRWEVAQSRRSETALQFYYQESSRRTAIAEDDLRTLELDFQHNLTRHRHNLAWGASYRMLEDDLRDLRGMISYDPSNHQSSLFSAFLQDEFRVADNVFITAGTKVQYDELSKLQWQPSIRGIWFPRKNQAVWTAATRAIRTPSRFELDGTLRLQWIPITPTRRMLLAIVADAALDPERVTTFEAGYRAHGDHVSVDVTVFHNLLDDVIALSSERPYVNANGQLVNPLVFRNALHGTTSGLEASATVRPARTWDLSLGYAFLMTDLRSHERYEAAGQIGDLTGPRHQWQLRSFITLTPQVELDATLFHVGARKEQAVDAYFRADLRLAWEVSPRLELSLIGQDVFNSGRIEFNGAAERTQVTPASQSLSGAIKWQF